MPLPYKITLVDEQPRVNEAGKVQTMKVVHYMTATGDRGTVAIPVEQYSADVITQMIDDEVAEIAKLRGVK